MNDVFLDTSALYGLEPLLDESDFVPLMKVEWVNEQRHLAGQLIP